MKLELDQIAFDYNGKEIFHSVSLTVESGEVLCLLGPNGTGKTTLFKNILGLLKLNNGRILLNGSDINSWSRQERAKWIAYVPQQHIPPFSFRVIDVVLTGRTAHLNSFSSPSEKDVQIAENALETLNIFHLRDQIYTEISGGERQLVLIARALTQQPHILVMDEPTANLDFGNQAKVLNHIKRLASKGMAIIMSTHYPDHAFLYATKAALMKDGEIFYIGEPDKGLTEDHLQKMYGINVKILHAEIEKQEVRVCIPVEESFRNYIY